LLCCAWLAAANLAAAQSIPQSVPAGPTQTAPAAASARPEAWGGTPAKSLPGSDKGAGSWTPLALPTQSCNGESCDVLPCGDAVCGPPGRIWVRGEYLLWWTKSSILPPLLTTSPLGTPANEAGVLGLPTTEIVFGGSGESSNPRSGGRITVGGWLDCNNTRGVEASFFGLESRSRNFDAASSGNPILVRPFFNTDTGKNDNLLVAYPGIVAGSFHASVTSSNLWGGEVLYRHNLCCGCCYRVDLLAGYRFLHLNEGLDIADTEINTDPLSGIPVGTRIDLTDSYHTSNNFNGGELGLEAEFRRGRLFVDVLGKVALGNTSAHVGINGATRIDPDTTFIPGGFLASPAQLGQFHRNHFAVVPEAGVRVGWQVTDSLRAFIGYTFIYWSDVARPGDQVSLAVSPSHLPPVPVTALQPLNIRFSDYWAQGLNFGVEFRY